MTILPFGTLSADEANAKSETFLTAFAEGFKAGQETMRERAAVYVDARYVCDGPDGGNIRSLSIEEPQV